MGDVRKWIAADVLTATDRLDTWVEDYVIAACSGQIPEYISRAA
jgi:hypothetical protein